MQRTRRLSFFFSAVGLLGQFHRPLMIQPLPGLDLLLHQPDALQTGAGVVCAGKAFFGNALRRFAYAKPEKVLHFAIRALGLRRSNGLPVIKAAATFAAAFIALFHKSHTGDPVTPARKTSTMPIYLYK